MARPRVFVSSTYYDLKHIRASLEVFIESLGFDAVLFEKGDIAFHPDGPLDESCYREARTADIFVLIIGGRYGSAATGSGATIRDKSIERYESITKKEFESAQEEDVPTFILVDSAVAAEYQTYLKNRDNTSVNYAHVDSRNVFSLLETIFERGRNNPVFNFDRATQIEVWLREQWAGLFRELLRSRSQQKQLAALNSQVAELKSINSTLKTYMEAVLNRVNPDQSGAIIRDEENKLEETLRDLNLKGNTFYRHLTRKGLSDEHAKRVFTEPDTADQAVDLLETTLADDEMTAKAGSVLRRYRSAQRDYNEARGILGRSPIEFADSSYDDVATLSRAVHGAISLDSASSDPTAAKAHTRSSGTKRRKGAKQKQPKVD